MEIFLAIALVLTNLGWLIYADRRDSREEEERRELLNRIAQPSMVVAHKKDTPLEPEMPQDEFEYAAVGQIDPFLDRGDENGER